MDLNSLLIDAAATSDVAEEPLVRKKRVALSLLEKFEIIRYSDEHPEATQGALRTLFSSKYGKILSHSTINETLKKNRDHIIQAVKSASIENLRISDSKFPELNDWLYKWVERHANDSGGEVPNTRQILKKAKEIGAELGLTRCQYSRGLAFLS